MLSVIMLNAIMLSVVAPKSHLPHQRRNLLAVLCPVDDVIKLFVFVTDAPDSGFVPGKSFEPSPIFVVPANKLQRRESRGRFVEQKLMLSSNFRCYQIHNCQRCEFGHTLLCYLSHT
jgi:hypothetical protein